MNLVNKQVSKVLLNLSKHLSMQHSVNIVRMQSSAVLPLLVVQVGFTMQSLTIWKMAMLYW